MRDDGNTDDQSSPDAEVSDVLRSFLRECHHAAFGSELIDLAGDADVLADMLDTNVARLQHFALTHLLYWKYSDDRRFVEFCKDTLTLGFDLTLRGLAILYLCKTFRQTRDFEIMRFLMDVMSTRLSQSNGASDSRPDSDQRLLSAIYGDNSNYPR